MKLTVNATLRMPFAVTGTRAPRL